ncbi:hypothetical protein AB4Z52_29405 [Rhizobium sp. 2YAF20]|uniref:hypothetical protein n=1 Tax=Rhizobium sp. 2YAF20 TaxID=3233027 RepID=UPI003F9DA5A0
MFRFLQAIINALINLTMAAINTATGFLDWLLARLAIGGAPPAAPVQDIEAALPDPEKLTEARDLEVGKAKTVDNIFKRSPEMQVKIFAGMCEVDRLSADLTLLSEDQVGWLLDLNDAQLKAVSETSDRRVAAALAGEPNALTAILSVNQRDPVTETALAARITAFRAGTLAPASTNYAIN